MNADIEIPDSCLDIEEMKKHQWIVPWSGGKDSTATVILMHELGIPIYRIVHVRLFYDSDTPATLPLSYEFVNSASLIFQSWGFDVDIIDAPITAVDIASRIYKKSKFEEKNGKLYGVLSFRRGACKFQHVKEKFCPSYDLPQMVGYTVDEVNRLRRLSDNKQSVLCTLGFSQYDSLNKCKEYGLLSPLYDLGFTRDGCFFCPNASKKERIYIRENYPELVDKINILIEMCDYDISFMNQFNHWVEDYMKPYQFRFSDYSM